MSKDAAVDVYKGNDGKFYYRVKAGNGEIIADSSQGYSRRWSAVRAANNLIRRLRDGVRVRKGSR